MHDTTLPRLATTFTDGDRLPKLTGVVKNTNLTGQIVRLSLARPTDILTKDATLTDAPNGAFEFAWAAGDLVAGVGQVALLRLIDGSGLMRTLGLFLIDVQEVPAP